MEIVVDCYKCNLNSFEDYYFNYVNLGSFDDDVLLKKVVVISFYDDCILDEMFIYEKIFFNEGGFWNYV